MMDASIIPEKLVGNDEVVYSTAAAGDNNETLENVKLTIEENEFRVPSTHCNVKTNCIESPLKRLFESLGRQIGCHPLPFLLIPIIIASCLGYGIIYFEIRTDTEYLVTPKNGPAKIERRILEKFFPFSEELKKNFLPNRAPHMDGFADVILTTFDEKNMLTYENLKKYFDLDNFARSVIAVDPDNSSKLISYGRICAKEDNNNCLRQPLGVVYLNDASRVSGIRLEYPVYHSYWFIGSSLGLVKPHPKINENIKVDSAGALRLTYFVAYKTAEEIREGNLWFNALIDNLDIYQSQHPELRVYKAASNSLERQFDEASKDILPKFVGPLGLLIVFSILSCMMSDWVRSKPWLALTGVVSTGLSLIVVFGLLSLLGIKAVPQVGIVPFLTLGVGVDNMFILISAWRRSASLVTNFPTEMTFRQRTRARVSERMALSMGEAALSITITTVTDVLAFGIGAMTDFPTVELFCLYTGLSIVTCYLFCITFFAAAMVFSGWREESNRHCLLFFTMTTNKEAEDRNCCFRLCCAVPSRAYQDNLCDGEKGNMQLRPADSTETMPDPCCGNNGADDHLVMRFFRDFFGPVLMKRSLKIVVIFSYLIYICVSVYGCWHLRSGVSFQKLSNINSYLSNYYGKTNEVFNNYGSKINILFTDKINLSDPTSLAKLETTLQMFEKDERYFYGANLTDCWFRHFKQLLKEMPMLPHNTRSLKYSFLTNPFFEHYRHDVKIDVDNATVTASRCYIQTRWNLKPEVMMLAARELAKSAPVNVTVYHPSFIYSDQPIAVLQSTLQNIGIAVGCMFLVAILLVPHPVCAIWVTITVASIVSGVVGFMTLWDVNVDFVSMTYLILCIGFSVDFAVHFTYGFIASNKETGAEKAVEGLFLLGYPILQSATSTLISVVFLSTSISYLFLSFFKIMVLVIVFGTWHAIFVLPVILSLVSGKTHCVNPCHKKKSAPKINKSQRSQLL